MHKYLLFLVFMLSGFSGLSAASVEGLLSQNTSFGPSSTDSNGSSATEIPREASKTEKNNYYIVAIFPISGRQFAKPRCNVFLFDKAVQYFNIYRSSLKANGSVIATLTAIRPGEWFGTCDADMRFDAQGDGWKKNAGFRALEMVDTDDESAAPIMELSFVYNMTNSGVDKSKERP